MATKNGMVFVTLALSISCQGAALNPDGSPEIVEGEYSLRWECLSGCSPRWPGQEFDRLSIRAEDPSESGEVTIHLEYWDSESGSVGMDTAAAWCYLPADCIDAEGIQFLGSQTNGYTLCGNMGTIHGTVTTVSQAWDLSLDLHVSY